MNKEIQTTSGNIGLPPEVFSLKPAKNSDFNYSYEIEDAFKQPENIIEEIIEIFSNIGRKIQLVAN